MVKLRLVILLILSSALLTNCTAKKTSEAKNELPRILQEAHRIAQRSVIVDGHVDYPDKVSQVIRGEKKEYRGQFSLERAKSGGLNAPFMSIYTTPGLSAAESRKSAMAHVDIVRKLAQRSKGALKIAISPGEVREHFRKNIVSLPMGMENGSPLGKDLNAIEEFRDLGISYIGLAHGLSNQFADSATDRPKWDGLSPLGEAAIREINRLGVMVDISHLSDAAFWDVIKLSRAPIIASHSSCRALTQMSPPFYRNMTDEMIRALSKNGGVIMINFGSWFLKAQAYRDWIKFKVERPKVRKGPIYDAYIEKVKSWYTFGDVSDVADHIDHAVKIAGIDHVGLGSDFDGIRFALPEGIKDVSGYPNLIAELLRRGYSEVDIKKILGENLLRVWGKVQELGDY